MLLIEPVSCNFWSRGTPDPELRKSSLTQHLEKACAQQQNSPRQHNKDPAQTKKESLVPKESLIVGN